VCGRYHIITDARGLIDFFVVDDTLIDDFQPRWNVAPGQPVPAIRASEQGRQLFPARWGLVPHWSKEEKPKYSTINARAETVAEKPTYRDAFKRGRCLIPATGFYEWQRRGETKVPHQIGLPDRGLFAFAGLWDHWEGDGKAFDSCSIIVTSASPFMKKIHDRMPVILDEAFYGTWLNPAHQDRAQLESLLRPYDGELIAYPVSRLVNSPKNDDSRCLEPLRE
jgi:putative SOS response-associated peptidase YedK